MVSSTSSKELLMCLPLEVFEGGGGGQTKTSKSTARNVGDGQQNSTSELLDVIVKGPTLVSPS